MNQNFRFVHAADLHLDSPLVGLESFQDAPVELIRGATREALKRLVDLCIEENVDFLLIAGDVYDGEWKSLATGRFFATQMGRLINANIPAFLIKGNHDAVSAISKEVTVPGLITLDHKKPETKIIEHLGVAIHGQSYAHRDMTENLSANYPPPIPGLFNIGLLHTSATSTSSLHQRYAPCTIDELLKKNYDYWALGHVHQRALLHEDPPILFPGNIQGRHIREPAEEGKGVTLVEVIQGEPPKLRHIPLDAVRWTVLQVDTTGLETKEKVLTRVGAQVREASDRCQGLLLAARIVLTGSCPASLPIHEDLAHFEVELRDHIQGSNPSVWLEEIRIQTRAPHLAPDQGSLADLLDFIHQSPQTGHLTEAATRLRTLRDRLQTSAPGLVQDLNLTDETLLTELLPDVEEAILSIVLGGLK